MRASALDAATLPLAACSLVSYWPLAPRWTLSLSLSAISTDYFLYINNTRYGFELKSLAFYRLS